MKNLSEFSTETLRRILELRQQRDTIDQQIAALAEGDGGQANQPQPQDRRLAALAKARAARWAGKQKQAKGAGKQLTPTGRKPMSAAVRARMSDFRKQWWAAQKRGQAAKA